MSGYKNDLQKARKGLIGIFRNRAPGGDWDCFKVPNAGPDEKISISEYMELKGDETEVHSKVNGPTGIIEGRRVYFF